MKIATVRQRTTLINAVRGHMPEFGTAHEVSRRVAAIPGVGPISANAIVATVGDASQFRSARHFAAWIELCRNSTAAAANSAKAASPSRAILICVDCSCSVPRQSSGTRAVASRQRPPGRGSRGRWSDVRRDWPRWRRPTRPRALPGRCWTGRKPIAALRQPRSPERRAEGDTAHDPTEPPAVNSPLRRRAVHTEHCRPRPALAAAVAAALSPGGRPEGRVKRILRKYGYPRDLQGAAVQKVLQQAEALSIELA